MRRSLTPPRAEARPRQREAGAEVASVREPAEAYVMGILSMLFVGLIAGALAKLIMPGKDPGGVIVTMGLGVAGSFLAGFLGRMIGMYRSPGSGPGIIASIVGAL